MRRNLRLLLWVNYGLIISVIGGFIYLIKITNIHNRDQEGFNKRILKTFYQPDNSLQYLISDTNQEIKLSKDDLEKINSHIDFLTNKLQPKFNVLNKILNMIWIELILFCLF